MLSGVLLFLRSATFLFWAIEHGHERVAKLAFLTIARVNVRGPQNRTPLMEAAFRQKPEMVRFLLFHNADWRAVDEQGLQAIHYASDVGSARQLLERGADVKINADESRSALIRRIGVIGGKVLYFLSNRQTV